MDGRHVGTPWCFFWCFSTPQFSWVVVIWDIGILIAIFIILLWVFVCFLFLIVTIRRRYGRRTEPASAMRSRKKCRSGGTSSQSSWLVYWSSAGQPSGGRHSEAVVTTVLNGQTRVALRVVAAPAVGAVHQVVSSAEPLPLGPALLDEFALSEIDPAPRGTAELLVALVRFELTRAAGASTPLLRVTCANQLQQRPGTANPCVTVPVGEYL